MSTSTGVTHTTVRVSIHRVTHTPAVAGRYANDSGTPATKTEVEVVGLTTRVDGVTDADLNRAIDKAVAHLDCERPEVPACLEVKS